MHIPLILKGNDMPKHLAIDASLVKSWALKNNADIKEALKKSSEKILELIEFQLKKDIPILTIYIPARNEEELNIIKKLFRELSSNESIHNKKVRVSVIGNWYDAEPELVDNTKQLIDKTKDYDQYFLNFYIKYSGQEEILTAVKLLLKKLQSSKISIDNIKLDDLKDNLPSSNFIPPDIIIVNDHSYNGLLLWDSPGSLIYFTDKYWMDFEKKDLDKAIDFLNRKKEIIPE